MKLLMRIIMPMAAENPALAAPDFRAQWQALTRRIGALEVREQGRVHFVILDIEPNQITPIAEAVFRLTGVKPEFLPQIVAEPHYGVRTY